MAWFTRSSRFALLAVALVLSSSFQVSAQMPFRVSASSLTSELERYSSDFRPPKRGTPDNRQGGATRGPCFKEGPELTALVPIFGGETTAESPTVFWIMPNMSADSAVAPAPAMEFTLKDANGKTVYSAEHPLTKSTSGVVGTPGIMSLPVAKSYPLEVGEEYKWQLRVTCDVESSDRSEDKFVEGTIKRVASDPNLVTLLQQATPEERVVLYARAKLWYEMLEELVELRQNRPADRNLTEAWNKLINNLKFQVSIQEPLFQGARTINN